MEVGLEGETSKINLRTIHSYSGAGLKHMSRWADCRWDLGVEEERKWDRCMSSHLWFSEPRYTCQLLLILD